MIDSLPPEIRQNILIRVPVKYVIRCTSVRKSWRSMIKNPNFIRTQLSRTLKSHDQNGTQLIHGVTGEEVQNFGYSFMFSDNQVDESYSVHYDNPAFDECCKIIVPVVDKEKMLNPCFRVVGTCNGLVCLADDLGKYGNTIIISNPSIRKSVTLPEPNFRYKSGSYEASIGFGFDEMTGDYKVVRLVALFLFDPNENPLVVEVYTLARGCWNYLESSAPPCDVYGCTPQAFVNGVLHWQAKRLKESTYFILTFDVGSESFSEMMLPTSFKSDLSLTLPLTVSAIGKSIAMFESFSSDAVSYLDIWEMKEYGIHDSWTKLMRLSPHGPRLNFLPTALYFRKCGEVVVSKLVGEDSSPQYELFSINLASHQFTSLGISGYVYYTVNSYGESLVLLDKDNAVSY